jgi:hypothetical protein
MIAIFVIPAKAGIQLLLRSKAGGKSWTAAFAGVTAIGSGGLGRR